jgi:hypothetical protein
LHRFDGVVDDNAERLAIDADETRPTAQGYPFQIEMAAPRVGSSVIAEMCKCARLVASRGGRASRLALHSLP